ncbi:hypothetical protein [Kibdelosporangium phytohabitans]|uniref:hypothetical protein n=1 Tax=Kibdelosporangium phytohabitans TaxID=860235 RepID=UPI0012F78267|nr:hypothetical protein [Kibdelosporangium phytohabitans]MBE1463761.1 hypothetical protein [Kibdelosporangium phytohabitans]
MPAQSAPVDGCFRVGTSRSMLNMESNPYGKGVIRPVLPSGLVVGEVSSVKFFRTGEPGAQ